MHDSVFVLIIAYYFQAIFFLDTDFLIQLSEFSSLIILWTQKKSNNYFNSFSIITQLSRMSRVLLVSRVRKQFEEKSKDS